MTTIEIEYCVPCGLLTQALGVEWALLTEFGRELERTTLTPGHGGVFEVTVDDDVVWNTDVHGSEIDLDLITDAVRERAVAVK